MRKSFLLPMFNFAKDGNTNDNMFRYFLQRHFAFLYIPVIDIIPPIPVISCHFKCLTNCLIQNAFIWLKVVLCFTLLIFSFSSKNPHLMYNSVKWKPSTITYWPRETLAGHYTMRSFKQLPMINPFFEDGRIHLDKNAIENMIRPLGWGGKTSYLQVPTWGQRGLP